MEDFILGVLLAIVAYLVWTKKISFDSIVNRFQEWDFKKVIESKTKNESASLAPKRAQIITEIVDTERCSDIILPINISRSYNKSLNSLLSIYIEPLQSENSSASNSPQSSPKLGFRTRSSATLSKDEIKNIFLVPSLESIIQLSNTILTRFFVVSKTNRNIQDSKPESRTKILVLPTFSSNLLSF